jgi:hypothetical protein
MNKFVVTLMLAASFVARADFSYTTTQKNPGGESTSKHYLKGQKMMTVMDFAAQTITTINNTNKTYRVRKFSDLGSTTMQGDVQVDVKSSGQKKTINGFNASEVVMTMQMDNPGTPDAPKIQMEMHLWISPDVPGAQEQHAFYQKNLGKFPWSAMAQGANPSMQKAMAELQRKMADMNGIAVLQTVKMGGGGGGGAGVSDSHADQMAQARARLEEMQKQGGPQAQAAAQALARMGAAPGGGGGSGFEINMESSNFSTASIPDSIFAIPAGYQQSEK